MSSSRRTRSTAARTVRAAIERVLSEQLERRVMLSEGTTAATLYAGPYVEPHGPQQATLWATATAEPIDGDVAPSVVNGVVYSDLNSGSGYGAFAAATGVLGMEDYDSINDANITLTQMKFVGGVTSAGMTLEFEFYNTSDVFVTEFFVSLSSGGNFIWTLGPISGITIPDAGRIRIRAQAGSTGQWFFSNAAPTVGTQSGAIGTAPAGNTFKFEYTNTSPNQPPVITSLTDTPDPVVASGTVTLTANGVSDPDSAVSSVSFYRESNGVGGLQTGGGGDTLLGTDTTASPYSINATAPASNGIYTYYAQAVDATPLTSNVVSTTNQVGVGTITGTLWNDANNNQTFDGGEGILSGWTVFLDTDRDQVLDGGETSTTTNGSGVYTFSNLAAGTYWVTHVIPVGWTQTYPGAAGSVIASANVMGAVVAEAEPVKPLPPGITTTGSDAPVYLPDGTVPVGGAEPFDLGNMFTEDLESNPLIRLTNFQADPRFSTIRGQGQAVAVIDTGIDLDHPAFGPDLVAPFGVADRIVHDQDFANGDLDATDFNGHGTNVASIVGSQHAGYPGMAPNVNIIALKVFTDAGSGLFSYTEAALQWVVANATAYNIVAINMSLGDNANYNTNQTLYGLNDELAALAAMNVQVISAAGNDYFAFQAQGVAYPAADPNSFAVGAVFDANVGPVSWGSGATDNTTAPDRIASFSQRSTTHTEIFAPGPMALGGNQSGGTVTQGGTSQAAPHIAGIAALAQQMAQAELGRRLTMTEYKNLLQSTGVSIVDGDDENDNVANTGATFKRVDVLSLGEAIRAMATSPFSHTVTLTAGQTKTNVNFGNRTTDATPPTADIVDVTPDPRTTATGLVTINFSENVTGVDKSDFSLVRDGNVASLATATFAAVNGSQYTLDLSSITTFAGQYTLTLNPGAANNIEDAAGNDLTVGANDIWLKTVVDGTAGNDTIKLVRNSAVINVHINNNTTPLYSVNIANLGVNVLSVLGGVGNDTINIDFAAGVPAPTNGLSVDGGAHTTGDTLVLTGTTAAESATFTATNFNFGATPIAYSNAEAHAFNGGLTGVDTLNVNGGIFTFAGDANVGTANLNVVVAAAGTVHFNTTQHLNNLSVAGNADVTAGGGSKYLVTKGLSITGAGKLDLRTHDLILNYSGGTPIGTSNGSVYTNGSVQRLVQDGAAGGAWNGNGIYTSDPNAATGLTAIGVAEALDVLGLGPTDTGLYETETVDATTIIVKYTYAGDANLDGIISGDDYASIDGNVSVPGAGGWYNGDFNWDSIVSGDDYAAIDGNIVAQGPPL